MKSKLVVGCVMVMACATWWTGCSDSTETATAPDNDAGGGAAEAGSGDSGGPTEGGTSDAAADTSTVDSSLSGPFVPIGYGTASCPAFVPCGGDETGLWKVTDGCVTEAIFDDARKICPTLVEKNVKFEARGTVSADGTTIARKVEIKFSASFEVPASCKSQNPLGQTCAAAETALVFGGLKTASCKDAAAGGGCDCDVTNELAESTNDGYTKAGSTITSASPVRTFDYCVDGNEVTYQETSNMAVPAIFVLTK